MAKDSQEGCEEAGCKESRPRRRQPKPGTQKKKAPPKAAAKSVKASSTNTGRFTLYGSMSSGPTLHRWHDAVALPLILSAIST